MGQRRLKGLRRTSEARQLCSGWLRYVLGVCNHMLVVHIRMSVQVVTNTWARVCARAHVWDVQPRN